MDWYQIKEWMSLTAGISMDALHVHAGILIQLLAALVLRRSIASLWPWIAVLAVVIANEYYDLAYDTWPTRDEQFAESIRDCWNTMLLPTLFFVLARIAPRLLTGIRPETGA